MTRTKEIQRNYFGGGHFKNVCSCGAVIAQCRCPTADKRRTVIPFGCEACKAQIANATQEQDDGETTRQR